MAEHGVTRRLAAGALALAALAAPAAARAAVVPLSADRSPADVDSRFGSGAFGRWTTDTLGLPAFRYLIDQQVFPPARQPELKGATEAQHQLGNDHIVAAAFNHGYTQLWSQDRLPQWANRFDPENGHYGGGFGYLKAGRRVVSTLYLDRPRGSRSERLFGTGYYERRMRAAGLEARERVYAPFGDDPLLLHDVTIRNLTRKSRRASWFEYWDVNPYIEAEDRSRAVGTPTWTQSRRTLSVPQASGDLGDERPLSIFAAAVRAPDGGHETSAARFFGSGTRAVPAAVAADRLSGSTAPDGGTLLAFRAPLRLRPGQSITLRYAYGMAHERRIAPLVRKYRQARNPFATMRSRWAAWLPKADFGPGRTWAARELQWDAYLLRSAAVFEEECGHHTITQGGYYQYSAGANLGSRSWLHYLLPMVYADPALAREILRFSVVVQSKTEGLPYGLLGLCTNFRALGTSDDLDFWLLLAAAEYGLGTRDLRFFGERHAFADSPTKATVWEHVKIAFQHQESLRGPHGGYLAGTNGDWSDFSSSILPMTESMLVPAQLAYAYPRLADLADLRGDRGFAQQLRTRARELKAVVRREWTGRGWYSRGYDGDRQIGDGVIFGEPQPWAMLAGAPGPGRARTLVANIRRFLTGVGAPAGLNGPARIGSAISPAERDPLVTDPPSSLRLDGASQWPGGSWYDVNGWLTWALAELDGTVPHAARYAWDEYARNTLAAHAQAFPRHWDGTISVDDACNAYYASAPANCGVNLFSDYQGQITEQPTWMVMNALNLAGLRATRDSYRIDPHLGRRFSMRFPRVGVARARNVLRGYVRVSQGGRLVLRVRVPRGARGVRSRRRAGGRCDTAGRRAASSRSASLRARAARPIGPWPGADGAHHAREGVSVRGHDLRGAVMAQRWFSEEQLQEMSRPTMDRALEAIEAGDLAQAKALCEAMKHEWRFLHDMMVDGIAASMSWVKEHCGEEAVGESQRWAMERYWKRSVEAIDERSRKEIVELLAATWRAHSTSGTGPHPGAFEIEEDDEKLTFRMNPCGSGQRLWRMGRYEGPEGHAVMEEEHDWAYGRKGFPIYCTHCTFMNEMLPIQWIGYPVYPSDPPGDFDHDPCTWYWYKDPADIPDRHWERYGLERR